MTEGVITQPDGTRIKITAPNKDALVLMANQLANGVAPARQNPAQPSGPAAFVRNATGGFIDNLIGAGELLGTLGLSATTGRAINDRVNIPFDSNDVFGGVQRLGETAAAVVNNDFSQFSPGSAADQQRERTQQLAKTNPIASQTGGVAGDVATLLTGRLPVRNALKGFFTKPGKSSPLMRKIDEKIINSAKVFSKSLGRGVGKAAEAGIEGATLALLDEGDPVKTAAFSAGGQAAGSLALTAMTQIGRRPVTSAFMALLIGNQIYRTIGPGKRDLFAASDQALTTIVSAYGLGAVAALGGAGRVGGGSFQRKALENAAETVVTALRGSAVSVVKDLSRSSEADQGAALTVINKLSTAPDFFGPTVRKRLESAVENDNLVDEINKLMDTRAFRRKFDQLE